jgi:hypothetical protein
MIKFLFQITFRIIGILLLLMVELVFAAIESDIAVSEKRHRNEKEGRNTLKMEQSKSVLLRIERGEI